MATSVKEENSVILEQQLKARKPACPLGRHDLDLSPQKYYAEIAPSKIEIKAPRKYHEFGRPDLGTHLDSR